MPSGITHMLLIKNLDYKYFDTQLEMLLSASRDFFQIGAVAPDLPYASVADDDFFLTSQSELADKFHYERTNELPIAYLTDIRNRKKELTVRELRFHFAFILGYISHIIADGIMHPFVRDKVGNYHDNQSEHRKLEMQIDVILTNHFTKTSGKALEYNNINIHDELKNIHSYTEARKVITTFQKMIKSTYSLDLDLKLILSWINGMHRLFDLAEGDHPFIYRNIKIFDSYLYRNFKELINKSNDILTLTIPKDRANNFMKFDKIHFIDDCIPKFYEVFIPIANKAYQYVYSDGNPLTKSDIPGIDLDTGRDLAQNNNLDLVPTLWS